MDDERLKNPTSLGVPDYFDELLERIRDIRASEKRMYLKIRDIFAMSADYQPDSVETQQFFQIIQNKLHWAATGKTAAEIIAERADYAQPNMGLTSWKGAKPRKTDAANRFTCVTGVKSSMPSCNSTNATSLPTPVRLQKKSLTASRWSNTIDSRSVASLLRRKQTNAPSRRRLRNFPQRYWAKQTR
jgi:hypothetical protein